MYRPPFHTYISFIAKRSFCSLVVILFLLNTLGPFPVAQADDIHLPVPGAMVQLSPTFNPSILKGIKVHSKDPFQFDFILDQGDERHQINAERLIKYFLASLTIPEKDLWVNLSPYENNRIVPEAFGKTEMGRDLLAEDYMLKQITASLIYPEGELGKKFWKRIYAEAVKKFGTTNIPVNTFNKVWIVPQKAVVYENAIAGTAYVVESKLKVMLEEDYLSLNKHRQPGDMFKSEQPTTPNEVNALGSQIVREIVIPELTKEVNEDRNFSQLRQVYNSLILATWYKKKIKDSILEQVYADKNKVKGVEYNKSVITQTPTRGHVAEAQQNSLRDRNVSPSRLPTSQALNMKATQRNQPNDVELIYQRYLQAFKKGAFNYIKDSETPNGVSDATLGQSVPRKYFSGGAVFGNLDRAMTITTDIAVVPDNAMHSLIEIKSQLTASTNDQAMTIEEIRQELIKEIVQFENVAYRKAREQALKEKPDVYWEPLRRFYTDGACKFTAATFEDELQKVFAMRSQDFKVKKIIYDDPKGIGFHIFLVVKYKGYLWIVDPTWQQYLNPSISYKNNFPKVMVLEINEMKRSFSNMIPRKVRFVWGRGIQQNKEVINDQAMNARPKIVKINWSEILREVTENHKSIFDIGELLRLHQTFYETTVETVYGRTDQKFLFILNEMPQEESRVVYQLNVSDTRHPQDSNIAQMSFTISDTVFGMNLKIESFVIKQGYRNGEEKGLWNLERLLAAIGANIAQKQNVVNHVKELSIDPNHVERRADNLVEIFLVRNGPDQAMKISRNEIESLEKQVLRTQNRAGAESLHESLDEMKGKMTREDYRLLLLGAINFIKIHKGNPDQQGNFLINYCLSTILAMDDSSRNLDRIDFSPSVEFQGNGVKPYRLILKILTADELKLLDEWEEKYSLDNTTEIAVKNAPRENPYDFVIGVLGEDTKGKHLEGIVDISDAGRALVADHIAVAPWNRSETNARKLKGVGSVLLSAIIQESFNRHYQGRIFAEVIDREGVSNLFKNVNAKLVFEEQGFSRNYGVYAQDALEAIKRQNSFKGDLIVENQLTSDKAQLVSLSDEMMKVKEPRRGGIDLNPANINLQTQNAGDDIKFNLDQAQLVQLQNAPGFTPVIISAQPMTNLRVFLGINDPVGVDKSV